jgi:hypothetical protein
MGVAGLSAAGQRRRGRRLGQDSDEAGGQEQAKKNALGGQRKSLKRLDSDKEIKANSFAVLWPGLAGFGYIWLD